MSTKTRFQRPRTARRGANLPFFLILSTSASVLAIAEGCSSTEAPAAGCTAGTTVSCACATGQTGTQLCGSAACTCASSGGTGTGTTKEDGGAAGEDDASAPSGDAGERIGDGGRVTDGASPASVYAACALQGSFGWPCSIANASNADAAGQSAVLDPTDCSDPNYPYCFLGGQGSWCTAPCTLMSVATTCNVEDAGCAPRTDTTCNAKGFCK